MRQFVWSLVGVCFDRCVDELRNIGFGIAAEAFTAVSDELIHMRLRGRRIAALGIGDGEVSPGVAQSIGRDFHGRDGAFIVSRRVIGKAQRLQIPVRVEGIGPDRQLGQAVDDATDQAAAYFMVNCAHADHFFHVLGDEAWARRIRGIRCNASRQSHEELDNSEALDDGNPVELGEQHQSIRQRMPWLNIFGSCCGSDLRHVSEIAKALAA